jgi:WD40 repeat protein
VTATPYGDRDFLNAAFDVQVFDAGTGAEVLKARVRRDMPGRPWTPVFSPDARYLVIAEGNGEVALLDVGANKEIQRLKGHQDAVWSLAFTPDGRRLATICAKMEVRIWDVTAGVALLTLQYPRDLSVNTKMAFSPNGHQLLVTRPFDTEVVCDATPRPDSKQP